VIGIFKNNNPLALLLLVLLAFLPGMTGDIFLSATVPTGATPIFNKLSAYLSFLDGSNGILGKIIYASLLIAEALLLNKIISDHKLMERAGFIPAMSFLVFNAILPYHTSPLSLMLNGVILLLLKLLIVIYKQNNANNQLLLTGFVVGCLVSMNVHFLILYLWISISVMIMRPASLREWLLASTGFILPFYFLASGLYLLDKLNPSMIFPGFSFGFKLPELSPMAWTKTCLFLILPWIGLFSYNRQIGKMMIQARKTYLILMILVLAILVICIFSIQDISISLNLMLVPSAALFAPFFLSFKRDFIPNLISTALIILALLR
jgi:hypothetical protein